MSINIDTLKAKMESGETSFAELSVEEKTELATILRVEPGEGFSPEQLAYLEDMCLIVPEDKLSLFGSVAVCHGIKETIDGRKCIDALILTNIRPGEIWGEYWELFNVDTTIKCKKISRMEFPQPQGMPG